MFPWNKMFPFPKDYMKENIFKQTDVENWMNTAVKGKLPASSQMMHSTDFFEQSFDMLNRMQAKKKKKMKSTCFEPNVFETHDEVFIRFPLASEEQIKQLKTYHNTTTCYIENVPNGGNKQTISLPSPVKSTGSIAKFKNGIVEIRIPKETNLPITKIPIEILNNKRKK